MQMFQIEFNPVSFAALLGFLAVGAYILTLLPTTLKIVFPATTKSGLSLNMRLNFRWCYLPMAYLKLVLGRGGDSC